MIGRRGYDLLYRVGAPWESGRWESGPRPEVVRLVESGRLRPGRAVDLGCGSGANVVYLAGRGFDVTGVDFSPAALAGARAAAAAAGVDARFVRADLTAETIPGVEGPYDLIVDYGVLQDLNGPARVRVAATVGRLSGPGTIYLQWCFYDEVSWWRRPGARSPGVRPGSEHELFGFDFAIERLAEPPAGR